MKNKHRKQQKHELQVKKKNIKKQINKPKKQLPYNYNLNNYLYDDFDTENDFLDYDFDDSNFNNFYNYNKVDREVQKIMDKEDRIDEDKIYFDILLQEYQKYMNSKALNKTIEILNMYNIQYNIIVIDKNLGCAYNNNHKNIIFYKDLNCIKLKEIDQLIILSNNEFEFKHNILQFFQSYVRDEK